MPLGWALAKIDDTGAYINGCAFKPTDWSEFGLPIIRIQNLTDESKVLNRTTRQVPIEFHVASGDLLLSWSATLDVFVWRRGPALLNQHIFRVAPDAGLVEPSLLRYSLIMAIQELEATEHLHGSTMKHINRGPFLAHTVPLPPRREQVRILEKLEELLSDLDAGAAELRAAQAKLKVYRQSLLKAAFNGELTTEWRKQQSQSGVVLGETGTDLLKRILKERRHQWDSLQTARFAKQGKAPPQDLQPIFSEPVKRDEGEPSSVPEEWTWTCLGQCFRVEVGATPSRKEQSYWNGDVPWVSSGEVQFSRIAKTRESITTDGLSNSSTRINPRGSVMLGMIGEGKTRGQVALLDIDAANNQNCAAIWVSETSVPPEFVYFWLWSRYDETRRGSSGNNQPALNKTLVERIPMPLPPVDECKVIVELVSDAFDQAKRQEAAIDLALRQSEAQRKNILKAAFSGQLVPQDPNDEPASVLLDRIRAERAHKASPPARRARKAKAPA